MSWIKNHINYTIKHTGTSISSWRGNYTQKLNSR